MALDAKSLAGHATDLVPPHQWMTASCRVVSIIPGVIATQAGADHEHRGRPAQAQQDWACVLEHAHETVVEGEQEAALRQGCAAGNPREVGLDPARAVTTIVQCPHVRCEPRGLYAVTLLPGIDRFTDAVVCQHQRASRNCT